MAAAKTVKVFKFCPTGSRNQGIEKVCCTGAQFLKTPFLHNSGEILLLPAFHTSNKTIRRGIIGRKGTHFDLRTPNSEYRKYFNTATTFSII